MDRSVLLRRQLADLQLEVPEESIPGLLWLLEELLRWNRRINLTAISDPLEGIEKHLVDSLTPLPLLAGAKRLLDLGSGGGFPGIPLKLARPELQVVSVDSVARKIAFQRHAIRQLKLTGIQALSARVENLQSEPEFATRFQVVTARAFAPLAELAELARPFISPDGMILAMKGAEGERELAASGQRLRGLQLATEAVHRLRLPASGAERTLIVLRPDSARSPV